MWWSPWSVGSWFSYAVFSVLGKTQIAPASLTEFPGKPGDISWVFLDSVLVLKGYEVVPCSSEASSVLAYLSNSEQRRLTTTCLATILSWPCLSMPLAVSSSIRLSRYFLKGVSYVTWHHMNAMAAAVNDTLDKISLLSGRKVLFTVMTKSVPHFVSQTFFARCFVCITLYMANKSFSSEFTYPTCNPGHCVLIFYYVF